MFGHEKFASTISAPPEAAIRAAWQNSCMVSPKIDTIRTCPSLSDAFAFLILTSVASEPKDGLPKELAYAIMSWSFCSQTLTSVVIWSYEMNPVVLMGKKFGNGFAWLFFDLIVL